jgi:pimeloyl-ACP methyl ester carboxylesterase
MVDQLDQTSSSSAVYPEPASEGLDLVRNTEVAVEPGLEADLGAESQPEPDPEIYFISGLGADWRVFQRLKLEGYRPVHIRWELPQRGESIEQYAQRLLAQVTTQQPIFVGLSFGGLMAVEMAKLCTPTQVIVISSAVTGGQIPTYFRIFRWLPLQLVVPGKRLLWAMYGLLCWLFDLRDPNDFSLFKQVLVDTDPWFLQWALNQVVNWRNVVIPANLVHIHGGRDRIFPWGYRSAQVVVPEGGHLMVLTRAADLSRLLMDTLAASPVTP